MSEQFEVVIHIPSIKEIQKSVVEYNQALGDLAGSLQSAYGTSNMGAALSVAIAFGAIEIGVNVASFGIGMGSLMEGQADYSAPIPTSITITESVDIDDDIDIGVIDLIPSAIDKWKRVADECLSNNEEFMRLMKDSKLGGGN